MSGSLNPGRWSLLDPDPNTFVFVRTNVTSMGSLACVAYWGKALADYPLCARRKPESTGAVRHGSMLKYEFSGPGRWHLT